MDDDDHLFAACARLARGKGWHAEQRDRLARLLADEERRRALFEHPRRMEFVERVLAEMPGERGAAGRMAATARRRSGAGGLPVVATQRGHPAPVRARTTRGGQS